MRLGGGKIFGSNREGNRAPEGVADELCGRAAFLLPEIKAGDLLPEEAALKICKSGRGRMIGDQKLPFSPFLFFSFLVG